MVRQCDRERDGQTCNGKPIRQPTTTRAKRDAKWKELAEKKDEARCHCGERFPKHLAEFMNNKPSVTHACKCGVVYVVKRSKFVAKQQNGAVAHGA